MSSSGSEERTLTVNQGSSIPELVNYIKHSFRDCKFNEVQNLLIEREEKMKLEIKNLTRDRDSLEKTQGLAVLKKLKLENELKMSRREFEKLKETITRLTEEQRVSSGRAKKAEDRFDVVSNENLKIAKEKDELISKLTEEINQLKNKNLEIQQLVEVSEEKLKGAKMRLIEVHKQAELYKSGVQLRLAKMEKALANYLDVEVEDLGKLADISNAAANGESVDLPDVSKGCKDSVADDINGDVKDVDILSPGVFSASNYTGNGGIGLQNKDRRNSTQSSTKEEATNAVHTSPGTQSGHGRPHVEHDGAAEEGKEPLVPGSHPNAGLPIKQNPPIADIIEISDSDEESNPGETTYTATDQISKRNREDSPLNFITKRSRSVSIGDNDPDVNIPIPKSSDDLDSDDDSSCSDGHMNNLAATLRNQGSGKKP